MDNIMEELENALKSVPDCYDDFLYGMKAFLKDDEENAEKIIEFIKEDPNRKTDDVIEYHDILIGISEDEMQE